MRVLFFLLLGLGLAMGRDDELKVEVLYKPSTCSQVSREGDYLSYHYVGRLLDGTEFDCRCGVARERDRARKNTKNAISAVSTMGSRIDSRSVDAWSYSAWIAVSSACASASVERSPFRPIWRTARVAPVRKFLPIRRSSSTSIC